MRIPLCVELARVTAMESVAAPSKAAGRRCAKPFTTANALKGDSKKALEKAMKADDQERCGGTYAANNASFTGGGEADQNLIQELAEQNGAHDRRRWVLQEADNSTDLQRETAIKETNPVGTNTGNEDDIVTITPGA